MDDIINLNVGGKFYSTSRSTLTRLPGTMLEAMFSRRHTMKEVDGRYFIDRDGKLFRYILSYLRDSCEWIPPRKEELPELRKETEYYGIESLVKIVEDLLAPKAERTSVIKLWIYYGEVQFKCILGVPADLRDIFAKRLSSCRVSISSMIEEVITHANDAGYDLLDSVYPPSHRSDEINTEMYLVFRRFDQ